MSRQEDGQSVVEAALTLPLLFTLIVGILELGFAFNAYVTLVAAAREAARAGAVYLYDSAFSQSANDQNRLSGTGTATPYSENIRDTAAASLGILKTTSPNFDKNSNVTVTYIPAAGSLNTRKGDMVSVQVTYQHDLLSQVVGNRSFLWLTAQATARIE